MRMTSLSGNWISATLSNRYRIPFRMKQGLLLRETRVVPKMRVGRGQLIEAFEKRTFLISEA